MTTRLFYFIFLFFFRFPCCFNAYNLVAVTLFFFFFSCQAQTNVTEITSVSKVIHGDSLCEVVSCYPKLLLNKNENFYVDINNRLESINEMNNYIDYAKYITVDSLKKKRIIGDYTTLCKLDTLICFEYSIKVEGRSKVLYRPVFVSLISRKLIEPQKVIPITDRTILYSYVKKHIDSTNVRVNLKAYEKNSTYAISYGCTEKDLILYLGKEGEYGGYYKVLIPLDSVALK